MALPDRSVRVLGVSVPDVSDWSQPLPAGKWSQFFGALSRRVELVGVTGPTISPAGRYLRLARSFSPHRATWKARAGFDLGYAAKRNSALERELAARHGTYDLIVQLQTLCSPRSRSVDAPYVIYTDNTMALTQQVYPQFAPLSVAAARRWEAFEAEVCLGAARVFTFSEFARRSVVDDYGCSPDRVVAIGAGANQMLESVEGKDYSSRRALFVGHPFEAKGGRTLLDAWRIVHQRMPDAELTIAGPKRNPVPGFGQGVSWCGWISRTELAQLYRSASVFVLPSMFDAWGHVFVEAMGHGLPCIGSDCCAMPELIEEGVSGRVVARGCHERLADAICELLADPDKARRMGHAGHQRVLTDLTWPRVIDRLVSHLGRGLG